MRRFLIHAGQVGAVSTFIYNIKFYNDMSQSKLLHDAIWRGDEKQVERLLQDGADVNAIFSRELPFTSAIELGNIHIAKLIINNEKFNPNSKNVMDRNPLFYAAKLDRIWMIERLKALGSEIDTSDIRGVTALGATGWYDAWKSAEFLIKHGADVDKVDTKGETALYRACSNVSRHVVEVLLDNNCSINSQTNERHSSPQTTAIMAAIPSKYELEVQGRKITDMIDIVKLLLSKGCDLNIVDKHGRTALHRSVDSNEFHSACLFMEHGCDLNIRDNNGLTPLHVSLSPDRPRYELSLCLLYYGCDANLKLRDEKSNCDILPIFNVLKLKPSNPQTEAHRQKLIDALIMATDFSNCDLSSISGDNSEAIVPTTTEPVIQSWPFSFQHQCRLVIRRTLASDILPKIDTLPLGWCLKRYLALDCDYRYYHPLKTSELHTAVMDNDVVKIESVLSSSQINVDSPLYNKTPLTLAAQHGHIKSTILLLKHGAQVMLQDSNGQSAMHVAAQKGKTEVMQVLISPENNLNCKNINGNTPLMEAASFGQFTAAMLLCLNGGDPSVTGDSQICPIHLAAGSGHVMATVSFINAGANVKALDRNGNTALHIAASKGILYLRNNIRLPALYKDEALEKMDAVKMILVDGDPKYTATDSVDYVAVIKYLLDSGCDPRIRNQDSKNVLDLSREFGFHEVNRLLQDWINRLNSN